MRTDLCDAAACGQRRIDFPILAAVQSLMQQAGAPDAKPFTVDLEAQTINGGVRFETAPRQRQMLLDGLDEIGLTLALEPKIAAFQAADRRRRPWIYA